MNNSKRRRLNFMAGKRNLVFDRKNGVDIFTCSDCGWARPYPRLGAEYPDAELKDAFDQHVCDQHPRPKKPREDLNQAAARVVSEAAENC